MSDVDPFPPRDRRNQRSRLEIRVVLLIVALFIVIGGLWVFFNGSPTADRRAEDSPDVAPSYGLEREATSTP